MKILLADDHAIMRHGLRAILEKRLGLTIVGEAATGREAIELATEHRPDVVVMDIGMPELNGIEATRIITRTVSGVKVIALSAYADPRFVQAMREAGAAGYVLKDAAADDLLDAIDAAQAGRFYVGHGLAGTDSGPGLPSSLRALELTEREREVLQLVAEGLTSKETGARLHISVPTVEFHRRQIMNKLGLRSIAELTKFAVREGLTPLDK
jgi:DNA-binding NarL/FixJ family response regulator